MTCLCTSHVEGSLRDLTFCEPRVTQPPQTWKVESGSGGLKGLSTAGGALTHSGLGLKRLPTSPPWDTRC